MTTPSADELPARTSAIVRFSQNGIVALALFYALVLGAALPLGTLARPAIDRAEARSTRLLRPTSLVSGRGLEQMRNVGAGGDDLGAGRAQLEQESGAIAVDELDSRNVEPALCVIGVRGDE